MTSFTGPLAPPVKNVCDLTTSQHYSILVSKALSLLFSNYFRRTQSSRDRRSLPPHTHTLQPRRAQSTSSVSPEWSLSLAVNWFVNDVCVCFVPPDWQSTVDKLIKKTNLALVIGTHSWREQFVEAVTVSAGELPPSLCVCVCVCVSVCVMLELTNSFHKETGPL